MGTATATNVKGIFQITKVSYDTWNCAPVIYDSVVQFKPMQVSTSDLTGLHRVFNLPIPATDTVAVSSTFKTEFIDYMALEKLSRFGFPCGRPGD